MYQMVLLMFSSFQSDNLNFNARFPTLPQEPRLEAMLDGRLFFFNKKSLSLILIICRQIPTNWSYHIIPIILISYLVSS